MPRGGRPSTPHGAGSGSCSQRPAGGVCAPDADETGTGWDRERETCRQQRLAAAEAHQARRQEAPPEAHRARLREEASAEADRARRCEEASAVTPRLWLSTARAAPVGHAAARTGLMLEQVVVQLAARIETGGDGTLSVPPFHPDHI
ncbi:hypothetical protein [Streptomyces sp. NPDC058326]|uniref:hypothetical protein n=1 Tax=Streptomyces sp. NPDC058326 TaxID=3346447 RepID=UPI0036E59FFD